MLDSSAAGEGLGSEMQRPRRSRTPIRQNTDDYIVGDKAFDDVLQDSAFEEKEKKPRVTGAN